MPGARVIGPHTPRQTTVARILADRSDRARVRVATSRTAGTRRRRVAECVARRSARAILLDGGDLLLIERARPGQHPYLVTIGGGCEPEDASLEDTVRREALEEAGATIDVSMQVLLLTDPLADGRIAVQHIFLATLIDIDPQRRTGPELTKPERGTYGIVRVPFTGGYLASIDLRPAALAAYLRENWRGLAASAQIPPPRAH